VKLYEFFLHEDDFEDSDSLTVATVAILSQIKSDIEDSDYKGKITVNALLKKLADAGVRISHDQLLDVVKQEPWSNMIADINGDNVRFNGTPDEQTDNTQPDETTGTLDKMAKRATNKAKP